MTYPLPILATAAEVDYLYSTTFRVTQQDVLRLQVTVYNLHLVQEGQSFTELSSELKQTSRLSLFGRLASSSY